MKLILRKLHKNVRCPVALLILCMLLVCGCGQSGAAGRAGTGSGSDSGEEAPLTVVGTIFPCYDFAREVGEGRAQVAMLLKPGEEVHSYEPTPQDILKLQSADLFIYVGGENDVWVEEILSSMGDDGPRTVKLMDLVDPLEEELLPGMMKEKGTDGEDEEETDEHVWTSPKNAQLITAGLAKVMAELDPEGASLYETQAQTYIEQLRLLDGEFREIVENAKRTTLVFGDRFPLRYFAKEYGLTCYAAFSGCSADSEPSAATLVFLTDIVQQEQIPAVFSIEFSSGRIAEAICEATGAEHLVFESCQNITRDEMEAGETYLTIMKRNEEALKKALN